MELLTKEKAMEVPVVTTRYESTNRRLYEMIGKLRVGQAIMFKKEEWVGKSHPRVNIPSYGHPSKSIGHKRSDAAQKLFGKKFSIRTLADKSGYIVIRKS